MGVRRKTREILEDHIRLREAGKLEDDLERNYHPEIVILTGKRVLRGHDGVRESAQLLADAVGETDYSFQTLTVDDRMGFSEWTAAGEAGVINDGVDSYLVEDGLICAQTIHYTVVSSELSVTAQVESAPREPS